MHRFTREEALAILTRWEPAEAFLDAYSRSTADSILHLPEHLEIYVGVPEEFFIAPETQADYVESGCAPILDNGNFDVVTFSDPDARFMMQMSPEHPGEIWARFECWQQYLAHVVLRVLETEDDDQQVRRIADLVRFRHLESLLAHRDAGPRLSGPDFELAETRFIANLT